MLRILGSARRLCDGLTRRDLLHVGNLGEFGLGLSHLLRWSGAWDTHANHYPRLKEYLLPGFDLPTPPCPTAPTAPCGSSARGACPGAALGFSDANPHTCCYSGTSIPWVSTRFTT